jgi:hypothetical protein
MDGWNGSVRGGASVVLALAVVLGAALDGASAEASDRAATGARLHDNGARAAVAEAIRGAARRLDDPRCQTLLTRFADAAGRPLRDALDAEGLAASDYLGRMYFYDGTMSGCRPRWLAYTAPGSHAVFVCGDRFLTAWRQNPAYAECAIIHEALHSLGLGENPPSWEEITARVLESCRH